MVEQLPAMHVRPVTFAKTRPLSPTDLAGITGFLNTPPAAAPAPKRPFARVLAWLDGLRKNA